MLFVMQFVQLKLPLSNYKNLIGNITGMEVDHIISVDNFKNKEKTEIYDHRYQWGLNKMISVQYGSHLLLK